MPTGAIRRVPIKTLWGIFGSEIQGLEVCPANQKLKIFSINKIGKMNFATDVMENENDLINLLSNKHNKYPNNVQNRT